MVRGFFVPSARNAWGVRNDTGGATLATSLRECDRCSANRRPLPWHLGLFDRACPGLRAGCRRQRYPAWPRQHWRRQQFDQRPQRHRQCREDCTAAGAKHHGARGAICRAGVLEPAVAEVGAGGTARIRSDRGLVSPRTSPLVWTRRRSNAGPAARSKLQHLPGVLKAAGSKHNPDRLPIPAISRHTPCRGPR